MIVSNGLLRVKWVFPASARDGEGFVSFALFAAKIGNKKTKQNKTKQNKRQIRDIIKLLTSNNGVVGMITHIHYHATHYTRPSKTRLVHLPTHAPDAKCNYTNKSIGKLSENKANNKEICTRLCS